MWLDRRIGLLVILISTGVHICVLGAVTTRHGRMDAYAFNSLDSREYYRIARNVVEHGTFSQTPTPPLKPDTWRTPGYPLFLAAVMLVVGKSPVILIVVQQILSVLNVWLLFRIARGYMSDRRAAVAAVLFLFEPYHLLYSLWLLAATFFVTVLLLTWNTWQRAVKTRQLRWFGTTGALTAFLVLVRPVAILVPIALLGRLIWLVVRERSPRVDALPRRITWHAIPVYALCAAVVVGAWTVRNRVVAGHFALSDQSGVVLAYFKAAEVVLWRQGRTADRYIETSLAPARINAPHTVWDDIDRRLRESFPELDDRRGGQLRWTNLAQGNKTDVDSFDISHALRRIGLSYIMESPISTTACCLARCGSVLTFPLNLAVGPATGVETDRLRQTAMALPYVLLCLAVLARLARRGLTLDCAFFPLLSTAALLLATTPQVDPRFRVPMIPLLIFIALLPKHRPQETTAS